MKRFFACLLALLLSLSLAGHVLALDNSVTEEKEEPKPAIVGSRVSLTEDMLTHFYMRMPEGGELPYLYVGGVRYEATETEEPGLYCATYPHFTLATMTEEVTVVPACRMDGKMLKGDTYYFSVRDYAMRLLAAEPEPALRRVLVSLLNFGAATQTYHEMRPYNLPNTYLPASDRMTSARDYTSAFSMTGEATQSTATLSGATLTVVGCASIKVYIEVAGQEQLRLNGGAGIAGMEKLTPNAEAEKLVADIRLEVADNPAFENAASFRLSKLKKEDGYAASTIGIFADRYSDIYYMRLRTAEGVSRVLIYSVESYAARALAGDMRNEEQEPLLHAMMAYGDAVRAYRDQKTAP